MRTLLKYLFRLAVLMAIGFVGYAMLAELPPPSRDQSVTVPLPQGAQ